MEGVSVRPAEERDAASIAAVWLDGGRHFAAVDPEAFQVPRKRGLVAWLRTTVPPPGDEREVVLVAERAGRVIGFAAARLLEPDPAAPWQMQRELAVRRIAIDAVGVAEAARGCGAGTALVRAAEQWGRERGAELALVDANWASGVAAGFYEDRLGYARRGLNLRRSLTR